jgi:hypothetical protein
MKIATSRFPGFLPIPPPNPNLYLAADGTWQELEEEPPVEHEELHTDNGQYDF